MTLLHPDFYSPTRMPPPPPFWHILPSTAVDQAWVEAVRIAAGLPADRSPQYAAQILWQRGMRRVEDLPGFLNPSAYQPTSPWVFGDEMHWAVERLLQASHQAEKVAIWGDFDADGVTSTAVLWDGLGEFFSKETHLTYYVPNRLTESHGLSRLGLDQLAAWGCRVVVTCDTGSTNADEIAYAYQLGMEVIVTDHHTLPPERPPVVAILNPRYFPAEHPLAQLSGVAVAYKLVEALYERSPDRPQRPLTDLLDLVAIGLIADLVKLTGDCRYLAQVGIERLQQHIQSPQTSTRPGVAELLRLCKRTGDRPTDISFGLGPRINAVSRIHGDARFCVELLTSDDAQRCKVLAQEAELANTRRKALQRDLYDQVTQQLQQIDLATTEVIVLANPQWPGGILGLVAGQIAQTYGRPTILLRTDADDEDGNGTAAHQIPLARGSARSVNQIDLYQLVADQAHLLHRFGGHPYAAGLSLPVENLSLFTEAINRQLRQQQATSGAITAPVMTADLTVTVADLGKSLFRELKLLEPYGMGNPVPRLYLRNVWFEDTWNRNIRDAKGGQVRYIKTGFKLRDDSTLEAFEGIWWGHYRDELPLERCDVIVELDFNTYEDWRTSPHYEVRLIEVRRHDSQARSETAPSPQPDWIVDYRSAPPGTAEMGEALVLTTCPVDWTEWQRWLQRAQRVQQPLAIAYPPPPDCSPEESWQMLVGLAKYLARTGQVSTRQQWCTKLGMGDRTLITALNALQQLGFLLQMEDTQIRVLGQVEMPLSMADYGAIADRFIQALQEDHFRQQFFYQVPLNTLQAMVHSFPSPAT